MARATTVWGVDIGQVALKALKLRDIDGQLQIEAFHVIEHPAILSQPDADRQQLIREALEKFLTSESLSGTHVVISVPGQSSFSRFVKLPPVESKRVPDIVRFEAEQQIPFPINEVIWRWQTFRDPNSPDVEVGIFALKRSDVAEMLHHFNEVNLKVDTVQLAPLALYNFMTHDGQLAEDGATLLADVGADKTDLVVADGGRIWTRTIQIGGNNFTEALVKTFKLSFEKAEALKRSAASSKYARQIFQAMRPVFADLVQEIQRSIGFYTSLHRETRFKRLIGLGNGFRLPGLQKFIEQNLNVPVARIDSYNKLTPSPVVNMPAFQENVLSFAVAYGLALQGLAHAQVATNLLPEEILRKRRWDQKRPWFAAAAVAILAALFCPGYRATLDSRTLSDSMNVRNLRDATNTAKLLQARKDEFSKTRDQGTKEAGEIERLARLFGHRETWPAIVGLISRSIEAVAPNQPLLGDYARSRQLSGAERERILGRGDEEPAEKDVDAAAVKLLSDEAQKNLSNRIKHGSEQALRAQARTLAAKTPGAVDPNAIDAMDLATLKRQVKRLILAQKLQEVRAFKDTPRQQRQVIIVEKMTPAYYANLATAQSLAGGSFAAPAQPTGAGKKGFQIELIGRTPLPRDQANMMIAELRRYSKELARWVGSVSVEDHRADWLPTPGAGGVIYRAGLKGAVGAAKVPDPLMPEDPNEDMANDTRFKVIWWIEVVGDGIPMAEVRPNKEYALGEPLDLLPEDLEPPDVVAAAKLIKVLPAGTVIRVEEVKMKLTTPWYRVRASDPEGKSLGAGWISGAALDAQRKKLKEREND